MCIQRDDTASSPISMEWLDLRYDWAPLVYISSSEVREVSARVLERLYYLDPSVFNTAGALQLWRFRERMDKMLHNYAMSSPVDFKQLVARHLYNTLVIKAYGVAVKRDIVALVLEVVGVMLQEE